MCCSRLGSESEDNPQDDRSYVVTGSGSGFTVTQEHSPHPSPNPRANGKLSFTNGNTR